MNEQSLRYLIEHTRYNDTESVKSSLSKISNLPEGTDITPLLEALNNDNTHIRKFAAEALGITKNDKAVSHLIKALNDKSIYVRKLSADALGNIGSKAAVPHLIHIINDENIYVRWAIAEAFGKIKDRTTVPYLIDLLNDESAYVRWASAKALGNIEDRRAIIHLKKLLEDEDSLVKVTAKSVLNKFEELTDTKSPLEEASSLNKEDTIELPVLPQKKKQKKRIKNKLLSQKKEIMELLSKSKTKNLGSPMEEKTGHEEEKFKEKNIKDKMLSGEKLINLDKNKEIKKSPFKEVIDLYSRKKYDTENLPIEQVIELLSTQNIKAIPLNEKEEGTDLAKNGNIKSFETIVNAIDNFISDLNEEENEEEEGEKKEDSLDELFGLIDYIIDELEEDKTITPPARQIETTGENNIIKEEKELRSEKKEKESYWKSTPFGATKKKLEEKYPFVKIPLADKKIFEVKIEESLSDIEEQRGEAKAKEEIIETKPVTEYGETIKEKEIKLPGEQFCSICRKKLIPEKKFCVYCGYKINEHIVIDVAEKQTSHQEISAKQLVKEEPPEKQVQDEEILDKIPEKQVQDDEEILDKIPEKQVQDEEILDKIPEKQVKDEEILDKIPEKQVHHEKKSLDEHINKYIKDLNNTSSLVRLKAVIKLGETDSEDASEALIAKLKNGDKEDIRWRIIESIGKLNKSNSVDILINFLKTEIPDIKIKIIETLAISGDKKAVKPVTEELKSELSVKLAAIETLGILGDREIVPDLIKELEDKDPTVRIRTVEALGRLGDKRAIEPIKNARKKEGIFSIIMKSTMASIIKKLENN